MCPACAEGIAAGLSCVSSPAFEEAESDSAPTLGRNPMLPHGREPQRPPLRGCTGPTGGTSADASGALNRLSSIGVLGRGSMAVSGSGGRSELGERAERQSSRCDLSEPAHEDGSGPPPWRRLAGRGSCVHGRAGGRNVAARREADVRPTGRQARVRGVCAGGTGFRCRRGRTGP